MLPGWRWAGFLLLSLISASAWIAEAAWPGVLPLPLRFGVHNALLCLLVLPLTRKRWPRGAMRRWLEIAGWGTLLLGVPSLLAASAAVEISAVAVSLIFTVVPAVVVLVAAHSEAGFGAGGGTMAHVSVALAGIAGAALILPFTLPESPGGLAWLGAMIVAAIFSAVAIVRLSRLLAAVPLVCAVAVICGALGLLELVFAYPHYELLTGLSNADLAHEVALFALVDAPLSLLTIWLVRDFEPRRYASIYVLAPLLTVVEGVVLVRPAMHWTLVVGSVLMGFAAWRMLWPPDDFPDAPLT